MLKISFLGFFLHLLKPKRELNSAQDQRTVSSGFNFSLSFLEKDVTCLDIDNKSPYTVCGGLCKVV